MHGVVPWEGLMHLLMTNPIHALWSDVDWIPNQKGMKAKYIR